MLFCVIRDWTAKAGDIVFDMMSEAFQPAHAYLIHCLHCDKAALKILERDTIVRFKHATQNLFLSAWVHIFALII